MGWWSSAEERPLQPEPCSQNLAARTLAASAEMVSNRLTAPPALQTFTALLCCKCCPRPRPPMHASPTVTPAPPLPNPLPHTYAGVQLHAAAATAAGTSRAGAPAAPVTRPCGRLHPAGWVVFSPSNHVPDWAAELEPLVHQPPCTQLPLLVDGYTLTPTGRLLEKGGTDTGVQPWIHPDPQSPPASCTCAAARRP